MPTPLSRQPEPQQPLARISTALPRKCMRCPSYTAEELASVLHSIKKPDEAIITDADFDGTFRGKKWSTPAASGRQHDKPKQRVR